MGAFIDQRSPQDEAREPILRSPAIVNGFIAVFVLVHLATQLVGTPWYEWIIGNFSLIPLRLLGNYETVPGEVWPELSLVTYAFLHGDWVHLAFNCMWFLIFATAVSRRVGTANFLLILLATTLGAALAHLVVYWGSPLPVVGASGAVSGLMGATFRFIFNNPRARMWPQEPLPLFSRPVMMVTAVWIVLNAVLGITGMTPEGFGRSIAWEAHLGGYLTGLLLFPLFDRRRSWQR
jgi:membrane associated rhomboid family serine protease